MAAKANKSYFENPGNNNVDQNVQRVKVIQVQYAISPGPTPPRQKNGEKIRKSQVSI